MTRASLIPALFLLALGPLQAQEPPPPQEERDDVFWEDPLLEDAARGADLVVLGEFTAVVADGATFKVEKTLAGPARDGAELTVSGLHHPRLRDKPPVEPGDRAYLLLLGDPQGKSLHTPTPTFGRFPIKAFGPKQLVIASLGDTFTRLPLEPAQFEEVLVALRGGPSGPLLAAARADLAKPDLDPVSAYAALRMVVFFGSGEDDARVITLLGRGELTVPERWVVRMAAAEALGRAATPAAVKKLLELASSDEVPAVRSVATRALSPAMRGIEDAALVRQTCEALARVATDASSEPIQPLEVEDPRKNEIDSPLMACLRTLAAARAAAGVRPALRALERVGDLGAVVAGLIYFEVLGDPAHVGAIAWRMREPGAEDELVNRIFARTLSSLTGESLGTERARWLRWWEGRQQEQQGPQGPEAPPEQGGGGGR